MNFDTERWTDQGTSTHGFLYHYATSYSRKVSSYKLHTSLHLISLRHHFGLLQLLVEMCAGHSTDLVELS